MTASKNLGFAVLGGRYIGLRECMKPIGSVGKLSCSRARHQSIAKYTVVILDGKIAYGIPICMRERESNIMLQWASLV